MIRLVRRALSPGERAGTDSTKVEYDLTAEKPLLLGPYHIGQIAVTIRLAQEFLPVEDGTQTVVQWWFQTALIA